MLGMTLAFFLQGFFGKKIGAVILTYYASLAAWYAFLYYSK
jgi:hypothetical protein